MGDVGLFYRVGRLKEMEMLSKGGDVWVPGSIRASFQAKWVSDLVGESLSGICAGTRVAPKTEGQFCLCV